MPLMGPTSPRTTTEDSTPTFHTFQVMKSMIKINKKDFAQNECYLAKNSQRTNLTMYLFLILSNEKILEKQKHQICSVSAKKATVDVQNAVFCRIVSLSILTQVVRHVQMHASYLPTMSACICQELRYEND